MIVLALQDKNPDTPGPHQAVPGQEAGRSSCKEWITTDSQGLDTRVELTELARPTTWTPACSSRRPIALQKVQ